MRISSILINECNDYLFASNHWKNWKWQQQNSIRDENTLRNFCGAWGDNLSNQINNNLKTRKLQITPYYLKLIMESFNGGDITKNPLWRQVVPFWEEGDFESYDGSTDNWELNHEMKTPICQHKYDNRVILRMNNICNSYCQFCYEALRTLEHKSNKSNSNSAVFLQSVEYIKNNPQIEEVILSGGEPLMTADEKLEEQIAILRAIDEKLLIRIHSRVLTFNPFRITDKLLNIFSKYNVNSFGVHICHPDEISQDFKDAIKSLQKVIPIIFSNMPFLKGINDDIDTLHNLFIQLYRLGVKPYYLYHYMPFSPGASQYKASLSQGIKIMSQLKRRISNIAMPEYVIPHFKGKFTIPLIENDQHFPRFKIIQNKRYYEFMNWQGETCMWDDS